MDFNRSIFFSGDCNPDLCQTYRHFHAESLGFAMPSDINGVLPGHAPQSSLFFRGEWLGRWYSPVPGHWFLDYDGIMVEHMKIIWTFILKSMELYGI